MTARRYCDLSCWLVGSFICLFPSMLVRLLTSGHRLLWPAAGAGGGRTDSKWTINIAVALWVPGGGLCCTAILLVIDVLG